MIKDSGCNDEGVSSSSSILKAEESENNTINENNVKSIFIIQQNHCESSEESEQFDELCDGESDEIDKLHQELQSSNSNSFKKEFLNDSGRLLI